MVVEVVGVLVVDGDGCGADGGVVADRPRGGTASRWGKGKKRVGVGEINERGERDGVREGEILCFV